MKFEKNRNVKEPNLCQKECIVIVLFLPIF